jgi:hypothetical protein
MTSSSVRRLTVLAIGASFVMKGGKITRHD